MALLACAYIVVGKPRPREKGTSSMRDSPRERLFRFAATAIVLGVLAASGLNAEARSSFHYSSTHRTHSYSHFGERHSYRIHRSPEEKRRFEAMTGHPHGWPGHVVDHIIPLACGGADAPSNMQWQTIAEGKAKDKWERKGCNK
jgi:hypothetical protein